MGTPDHIEPFTSVASIPGTAEALGGNATGVVTVPRRGRYAPSSPDIFIMQRPA